LFPAAALLRLNFEFDQFSPSEVFKQSLVVSFTYVLFFLASGSYSGILRHTSIRDAYNVLRGISAALFFLIVTSSLYFYFETESWFAISRSVLLIHYLLVNFVMLGFRFFVKTFYHNIIRKREGHKQNVVIFGAGGLGAIVRQSMERDVQAKLNVISFGDDNPSFFGKSMEGIPVLSMSKILTAEFIEKYQLETIIIAISDINPLRRREIAEKAIELGLEIRIVPSVDKWISGQFSLDQLRNIRIEDLLERTPITLNNIKVSRMIRNRRVLITGAAGSIGSEIARQVVNYQPNLIIALDQAETPLFEMEQELGSRNAEYVVADVANARRMEEIFKRYRPDVVYHAAAYKHVPLMEANVYEALQSNVIGTFNCVSLAMKYETDSFVLVSTDKAINPTNVMGASKRLAEMICTAMQSTLDNKTHFITTRFGNVLGSNGSVIPTFRKQIAAGGPVTVTHPEITRYFMTIPEACNLVLEAGAMGSGGEIFVFDMGESVKIVDLAKKMIRLSGYVPNKDISIVYSGLRPGEKLYEELLATDENIRPTHHEKVMIAKVRDIDVEKMMYQIQHLRLTMRSNDEIEMVKALKMMIPEFKSNNSVFSDLDK
jgi:FlaA1/EpsC-like NDP-sugar epimerase